MVVEPSPSILVVDDERVLRDTLAYNLRREGFRVRTAADGAAALAAARAQPPDLILLDVLLPGGLDGFQVCRLLRQELRCPILLLSALGDEVDRVVGLEVGADDYVVKPFSTVELLARIKAKLRRASLPTAAAEVSAAVRAAALAIGPIHIDPARREARIGGRELHLKRRTFDLLHYLARHAGTTLSRARLLEAVWPEEVRAGHGTRTVDVHVRRLREAIEPDPGRPQYVHTVRGLGYAFRVPAARRDAINPPLKTA